MLADSAPYFLFGVALAGILWLVLNESTVKKLAGGSPVGSVFKAALIGLPLPLCSCSVLPVATQLRRSGFARGGTMAFLVSTPESGVDSILLTYALTDPLLTVARPVAAYASAVAVGLTEAIGFEKKESKLTLQQFPQAACSDDCCCHAEVALSKKQSIPRRIWSGLKYAVTDLIADLAPYMLTGFLLAGLIEAILRSSGMMLPELVTSGWIAYAWAVVIGVPLYVCATSSTPLAAVLLGAGFSPGAILVFLLVGPATNVASLVVLRKVLGGWAVVRFVGVLVVVAIGFGILTDHAYQWFNMQANYTRAGAHHEELTVISVPAAFLLAGLILYYSAKRAYRRLAIRFA